VSQHSSCYQHEDAKRHASAYRRPSSVRNAELFTLLQTPFPTWGERTLPLLKLTWRCPFVYPRTSNLSRIYAGWQVVHTGFDGWVPYELGHVERPNWSRTSHAVPTDTSLEQARSGDVFPDLDENVGWKQILTEAFCAGWVGSSWQWNWARIAKAGIYYPGTCFRDFFAVCPMLYPCCAVWHTYTKCRRRWRCESLEKILLTFTKHWMNMGMCGCVY